MNSTPHIDNHLSRRLDYFDIVPLVKIGYVFQVERSTGNVNANNLSVNDITASEIVASDITTTDLTVEDIALSGELYLNSTPYLPVGVILPFGSITVPTGWLACNGQSVLIATYNRLFTIIGETYGDASEGYFVLPDMRGRVPVGNSNGVGELPSGITDRTFGIRDGTETTTLDIDNLPAHAHTGTSDSAGAHTHTIDETPHSHELILAYDDGNLSHSVGQHPAGDAAVTSNAYTINTNTATTDITINSNGAHTHTITIDNIGGGESFLNMQPYITLNYIIRY